MLVALAILQGFGAGLVVLLAPVALRASGENHTSVVILVRSGMGMGCRRISQVTSSKHSSMVHA
jgi:hypothetical protein